jgi:hypothetical protein
LATRAQIIRESIVNINSDIGNPNWFLQEPFWDFLFGIAEITADVFRYHQQPLIAGTINTVVAAAQHKIFRKDDVNAWLNTRLQSISQHIQEVDREEDSVSFERLDAQLELIAELTSKSRSEDGQEENH